MPRGKTEILLLQMFDKLKTKEQIIVLIEDVASNSVSATLYQIASLLRIVKQDIKLSSLKKTERERILNSVNAIKARVEEYNANSMWEPSKMSIGVL